jgi:predicted HicB family RNase H-like nuclease
MNTIECRGYKAEIDYSHDDNCFFGKIISISDLVMFEAKHEEDMMEEFKIAIEDYEMTKKRVNS